MSSKGKKISPYTTQRLLSLYLQGRTEAAIASRLHLAQSTISAYVTTLDSYLQQGEDVNMLDQGISYQIKELHDLAAELLSAHCSVEECRAGLRCHRLFLKCGIHEEDADKVIKTLRQVSEQGAINILLELSHLEIKAGVSYHQLLTHYNDLTKKTLQAEAGSQAAMSALSKLKAELADIGKLKLKETCSLNSYLKELGLQKEQVHKVEKLAKALKTAGVSEPEIDLALEHLTVLSQAKVPLKTFAGIVLESVASPAGDGGQGLLADLKKWNGLTVALQQKEAKIKVMDEEAAHLDPLCQQKIIVEQELTGLSKQKAQLEVTAKELGEQSAELAQVKDEVQSLTSQNKALKNENLELVNTRDKMQQEIAKCQKEVSDLHELQSIREAVLTDLATNSVQVQKNRKQLKVLDSLLGFLDLQLDQMKSFIGYIPEIDSHPGDSSHLRAIRDVILGGLTGNKLRIMSCPSCHLIFADGKKSLGVSLVDFCPRCNSVMTKVIWDEAAILKEALAGRQPHLITARPVAIDKTAGGSQAAV